LTIINHWFTISLHMTNDQKITNLINKKGTVRSADLVNVFGFSRQYASRLLSQLASEKKIIKVGSTRASFYTTKEYLQKNPEISPKNYFKTLTNKDLEEHKVLDDIERNFILFSKLPENIKSIFEYAFSEMLNNAIEHSETKKININISILNNVLTFEINDFGVGAFRNIMKKRALNSEIEAIQDLLKGKVTTAPKLHSGEGIFFTSKVGDEFLLDSYGYQFIADNKLKDIFVKKVKGQKQGTLVIFNININSHHHLNDIFKEYSNLSGDNNYGFDKTEVMIRLYTMGGINVSRSQARRVLSGLDKFKIITMDYDQVPTVGQAFADEIYRVFKEKKPEIKIQNINMNEAVKFMVERAINEAKTKESNK